MQFLTHMKKGMTLLNGANAVTNNASELSAVIRFISIYFGGDATAQDTRFGIDFGFQRSLFIKIGNYFIELLTKSVSNTIVPMFKGAENEPMRKLLCLLTLGSHQVEMTDEVFQGLNVESLQSYSTLLHSIYEQTHTLVDSIGVKAFKKKLTNANPSEAKYRIQTFSWMACFLEIMLHLRKLDDLEYDESVSDSWMSLHSVRGNISTPPRHAD